MFRMRILIVSSVCVAVARASCTVQDYISNTPQCRNTCAECEATGWNPDSRACANCHCALTQKMPQKPIVELTMCHMHSSRACCIPVFDTEILEHYEILLDAGDRCAQELTQAKRKLRDLFCLACSPDQPKYLIDGKLHICRSFAEEVHPEKFDGCGLIKVEERGMPALGDDSVFPSLEWDGYESFINDQCGAKPPFLEDYDVVIVDDDQEGHAPCFGISAAASTRPFTALIVLFALLTGIYTAT